MATLGAMDDASAQSRRRATSPPAPPPAIVAEPLPPPARAEPEPPPPPAPLQRRIDLAEIGLGKGAVFGPDGRDLVFPLPRGMPGLAARLSLDMDLVAPFAGRYAVELRANGRLLAARAFAEDGNRLAIAVDVPPEDLAREAEFLRLNLRLIEQAAGGAASATLRPESHVALLLPDGVTPSVAALYRLLPRRTLVLTRPGPLSPVEAAAALRIGLALAATGREVRIANAGPLPHISEGGPRIWETGAVLVGIGQDGASVIDLAGVPALALGGDQPEMAARLLEGPWRAVASMPGLAVSAVPAGPGLPTTALPFSELRGDTAPQEGQRTVWNLEFSTRDLPPRMRPQALEVELRAAPNGGRAVASVLLNEVLLGAANLPGDGIAHLRLNVPEQLVGLDNRITVALHRTGLAGPSQLMPESTLRLGPAPAPKEFLGLPPAFADGIEVILDAPGGVITADSLNTPLWVLRALAPAGAPIRVTPLEPGAAPRPNAPFLAATREPPAGTTPALRFDGGRIALSDRAGRQLLEIGGADRLLVAQLLTAEAQPGLWLRGPGAVPMPLPPDAPRLDRGDVALLDPQGVALAWSRGPGPLVQVAYPDARQERSALLVWRPWAVGAMWLAGVALVVFAFNRPRREPVR